MDPIPMMDSASYANGASTDATPFHLPEIWHFPPPGAAASADSVLGLGFTQFGGHTATAPTREVLGSDPINSEQRPPIPNRKRRDSEEESAKGASTSNGGANANAMSDGDGKRMKATGNNRSENGKGEAESSSGFSPWL